MLASSMLAHDLTEVVDPLLVADAYDVVGDCQARAPWVDAHRRVVQKEDGGALGPARETDPDETLATTAGNFCLETKPGSGFFSGNPGETAFDEAGRGTAVETGVPEPSL